jgi:hypothetical protein
MCGAIPPLLQYAFLAWCSVKKKHRDNFTLLYFTGFVDPVHRLIFEKRENNVQMWKGAYPDGSV